MTPHPRPTRLTRGARLRWGTAGVLAAVAATGLFARMPERTAHERRPEHHLTAPRAALSFAEIPKNGNWCAMYVRLAANELFGMTYRPGDAWTLAQRNRSVWTPRDGVPFTSRLKPGYVMGVYNPTSSFNARNRPYTHVAIYLGNNRVMHRVGTKDKIETIPEMLEYFSKNGKKSEIKEIIAPEKE